MLFNSVVIALCCWRSMLLFDWPTKYGLLMNRACCRCSTRSFWCKVGVHNPRVECGQVRSDDPLNLFWWHVWMMAVHTVKNLQDVVPLRWTDVCGLQHVTHLHVLLLTNTICPDWQSYRTEMERTVKLAKKREGRCAHTNTYIHVHNTYTYGLCYVAHVTPTCSVKLHV